MHPPRLAPWTTLRVLEGTPEACASLSGREALAELCNWKHRSASSGVWFLDVEQACEITDPDAVDWSGFPEAEALAAAAELEERRARRRDSAPSGQKSRTTDAPPSSRTLLVVDDDGDYRAILKEALAGGGYAVEDAEHGRAALERIHTGFLPDLVLLDLHMPVMDGWSFLVELKRTPGLASIPVVVMTQAGDRVLASAPVSAGYLSKPFEPARLLQTIEACFARRHRP
jgi:two-component system, chemotaxis family, chemotaxis protein CheY